jgi:hypothetical protein
MAGPVMAQPAQNEGPDEVRDIIRRHIGSSDVPYRQRQRDGIDAFRDRRFAASKRRSGRRSGPDALMYTENRDTVLA